MKSFKALFALFMAVAVLVCGAPAFAADIEDYDLPEWDGFDFGQNLDYNEEYKLESDPGEYAPAYYAAKLTFDFARDNDNIPGEYSDDTEYTMTLIDLDDIEGEECYIYRLDDKAGEIGAAYGYAYQSGNIYMQGQGGQFVLIGKSEYTPPDA
jgi:hypothetical protein